MMGGCTEANENKFSIIFCVHVHITQVERNTFEDTERGTHSSSGFKCTLHGPHPACPCNPAPFPECSVIGPSPCGKAPGC